MLSRFVTCMVLLSFLMNTVSMPESGAQNVTSKFRGSVETTLDSIPLDVATELLGNNDVDDLNQTESASADFMNTPLPQTQDIAKSGEEVTMESLKLVGRGVQNRRTGDIIALACVGQWVNDIVGNSCKEVRHVKFTSKTQKLVFWGEKIPVVQDLNRVSEPTESEVKEFVKTVNSRVKKYKIHETRSERGAIVKGVAGASMLAFGATFIANDVSHATTISNGAFLASWVGLMALIMVFQYAVMKGFFPKSGVITHVFANQGGWNWSMKPKKVSRKTFRWIDEAVHQM